MTLCGPGRRRRIIVRLSLAAALVLCTAGALFYHAYPGFCRGLINQLRYADRRQNANLYACISYWIEFMQALRFNPATGVYGFADPGNNRVPAFARGRIAYHRGEFPESVEQLRRAVAEEGESEERLFWLALAYMRQGESRNCLERLLQHETEAHASQLTSDAALLCALPLRTFHTVRDGALRSAALFERLLDRYGSNRLYQWLLNVNYMTVGQFPEGVPARYRIDNRFVDLFYGRRAAAASQAFASLRLEERASEYHVALNNTGRGVAVEDFDGDGYLDIVTGGSFEDLRYLHNERGHDFVDLTSQAGLAGIKQPFVIVAADYDNDGWMDLFVSRPFGRYALLRNERGRFRDMTAASGLLQGLADDEITATWIPSFADVDADGDLDLLVAQWGFRMPFVTNLLARPRADSQLYLNEGGHFTDATDAWGLRSIVRDQYFIGSAFGDYDADGYPDLFLSSPLLNTSVLLHNEHGTAFKAVPLTDRVEGGFSAAFLDFNQDGRLDILQAGFGDARTSTEQAVFGEDARGRRAGHTAILIQRPDGTFENRTDLFDLPMSTMGASYGDLDNDGCFDFYLGTGDPEPWFVLPNLLYMGTPDGGGCAGRITNVSMQFGVGTLQKGHGIVFFDVDNDGREDIYSSLGGMWPGDRWPNQLFMNRSTDRNAWTGIRLRGRQSNRFGVGARLEIAAEDRDGRPIVRYYTMDNKTGFGSAPYLAHVGLGPAVRIDHVEVWWPASRCRRQYPAALFALNVLDESGCGMVTAASTAAPQ